MRNLKLVKKHVYQNPLPISSVFCTGENSALFLCENSGNSCPRLLRISFEDNRCSDSEVEELFRGELLQNVFIAQFVSSTCSLFFASTAGAFLQYYIHTEVQELFQSPLGISTFSVSEDSRLVVIITKENTLLLLSLPDLEVVTQIDLTSGDINATKTESVTVSWRNDSRYFSINYHDSKTDSRRIAVYEDGGLFFSTTEDCNPLICNLVAWQPSGGLIASIGRSTASKDHPVISLFELNGLKRADFRPFEGKSNHNEILAILWNSSSQILALRMLNHIELWTRNNYMWMCKWRITADCRDNETRPDELNFVGWDAELADRLHIVYKSGIYIVYDFAFCYTSGLSAGSGITASVDGSTVYCTPFRDNCAPPPYCSSQISLEAPVVEVIVSSLWNGIVCVLSDGNIAFYRNAESGFELEKTLKIPEWEKHRNAYNWIWPNRKSLCCIYEEHFLLFEVNCDFEKVSEEEKESSIILKNINRQNCISIQPVHEMIEETDFVLVQKLNGLLVLLNMRTAQTEAVCKFPQICSHISYIFTSEDKEDKYLSIIAIGHDPLTRKLYAGSSRASSSYCKLSGDCTSIFTFHNNLLFTTIQGSLEIVDGKRIDEVLHRNSISAPNNVVFNVEGQYSRKAEKGAVIVNCCLNQMLEPSLVLQIIPRGNLETIFPRPLIISSINALLRNESVRNFNKIMAAMRRHRIDYNILIDQMKKIEKENSDTSLTKNLAVMVDQVKDNHSLVLLVTDMNPGNLDCVKIIKEILEVVTKNEEGRSGEQPYLAAMAKLGLFEEVLRSHLINGQEDMRELVKSRIKFLSFYCDNPEILYEAALGTYDLNLAAIVADCLNKDPKEYLPILGDLRALTTAKRCFTIDNNLRRFSKALKSLIRDPSIQHDEILKYVGRHRLFSDALDFLQSLLFAKESEINERSADDLSQLTKEIQNSYGSYLQEHGKLKEASIFYTRGGNSPKAIDCCMKSGCWESALQIAYRASTTSEDFEHFCKKLLESLEDREEFENAARLSEVYLKSTKTAVEYWVRARKWTTASALCMKDPNLGEDMLTEFIKPKLVESYESLQEFLRSTSKDTLHYVERLRTVKALKDKPVNAEDDNDAFSDTDSVSSGSTRSIGVGSSSTSNMSGKTSRSGKNRRKLERKVFSLKEGSPHEDIGITVHLWDMFHRIQHEVKKDVAFTIESLWRFELDHQASCLMSTFDALILEVDDVVKEIWATVLPENTLLGSKYRLSPSGWSTNWDKLSLTASPGPGGT